MSTLTARRECAGTRSDHPIDQKVACLQHMTHEWQPPHGITVHPRSEHKHADFDVTCLIHGRIGVCLVRRGEAARKKYFENQGMIVIFFDANRTPDRGCEILVHQLRCRGKITHKKRRYHNKGEKRIIREMRRSSQRNSRRSF